MGGLAGRGEIAEPGRPDEGRKAGGAEQVARFELFEVQGHPRPARRAPGLSNQRLIVAYDTRVFGIRAVNVGSVPSDPVPCRRMADHVFLTGQERGVLKPTP